MTAAIFILAQAESAEEESSNFLVSPNVGLMIWTLLAFLVAMFILRKYAWPAITEALDKRQRAIEESIDVAERTRSEAQEVLQEYRERLREARAQADELMGQTRRDIAAETRRAIQEIRNEVADLTVKATEKVTRKTLDEDDQKRLVEEALQELDFSALAAGSGE